jgi:hypothetical protein
VFVMPGSSPGMTVLTNDKQSRGRIHSHKR